MDNPRSIILLAAVAIIIGSLLPWASVQTGLGSISVNGIDGDGKITLGIGVLLLLGGLLLKPQPGRRGGIAYSLFGVVVGLIALIDITDIGQRAASLAGNPFGVVQTGVGLYIVGVGALVMIVGGLMRWPDQVRQAAATLPD